MFGKSKSENDKNIVNSEVESNAKNKVIDLAKYRKKQKKSICKCPKKLPKSMAEKQPKTSNLPKIENAEEIKRNLILYRLNPELYDFFSFIIGIDYNLPLRYAGKTKFQIFIRCINLVREKYETIRVETQTKDEVVEQYEAIGGQENFARQQYWFWYKTDRQIFRTINCCRKYLNDEYYTAFLVMLAILHCQEVKNKSKIT